MRMSPSGARVPESRARQSAARSELEVMQEQRARQILQSLVQGLDPFNGEELPPGTVLQQADVLRALLAGVAALEQLAARATRRSQLPQNIGRSWSAAEQSSLIDAFQSGEPLDEIASRHGRTLRAIEARLEKLGLIQSDQRTTHDRFGPRDPPPA
jgi:catalase (peroxidase I)